jgi:hypothetical protein
VSVSTDLFPAGAFRFHLTLRREQPADFFQGRDASGRLLAERARWMDLNLARHVQVRPEGEAVVNEFASWAGGWAAAPVRAGTSLPELGRVFEPDMLFLTRDEAGQFRLQAGVVCFPSGWSLEEKMGHSVEFIHDAVPGLNPALGHPIHQFLSRMKPGTAFFRANWGLAATDELNLHPARGIAAPEPPVALDRLWLRIEDQVLVALPQTGGIVFGIRIALWRLDELARDKEAAAGLRRGLATMPADVASYKRVDAIRDELVALL